MGTRDAEMATAGQNRRCPSCGQIRWHQPDCPELRRKTRAALWVVPALLLMAFLFDRLSSESLWGSVAGYIAAGVGCAVAGAFIWRQRGRASRIEQLRDDQDR